MLANGRHLTHPLELPGKAPDARLHRTLSGMAHLIPSSTVTRTAFALQTTPQVNEPELIARVLAGDRLAGRELYNAHAPRVFRLAYRLTGDAELAREFTQDTFVRAFQRLADFRGDAASPPGSIVSRSPSSPTPCARSAASASARPISPTWTHCIRCTPAFGDSTPTSAIGSPKRSTRCPRSIASR